MLSIAADRSVRCCSSHAHFPTKRVTDPVSRREALSAAALARARSSSRATRTAASAAWPATCARWPARWTASPSRRPRTRRPALPGVLPHQLLALHLLRLLRGGLPDLRHPAHAGLRDERVPARQNMVYEKEDLLISGPGKYHGYNFYRVAGVAIGGKDKGEARERSAAGRRAEPDALRTATMNMQSSTSRPRSRSSPP